MPGKLLSLGSTVKRQDFESGVRVLPFGSMAKREPKEPGELGRRILSALEGMHMSPTALERKLIERSEASGSDVKWSQGYMSRLISGERGGTAIDPLKIQDIADELGVRFEWLATGREPMREGGEQTPQQVGLAMARMLGAREDAIEHVREIFAPDSSRDARYWYDLAMHESDALRRLGTSEFPATARKKIRKEGDRSRTVSPPKPMKLRPDTTVVPGAPISTRDVSPPAREATRRPHRSHG